MFRQLPNFRSFAALNLDPADCPEDQPIGELPDGTLVWPLFVYDEELNREWIEPTTSR